VAAEHRHARAALLLQGRPDRHHRVVDVPAVADEDLHLRRAREPLHQALDEQSDLAADVGLGAQGRQRRPLGDGHRFVVARERGVEDRLGQPRLAAEPLVDALRRDARVRGDRGDRRHPEAVALEQLPRSLHDLPSARVGVRPPSRTRPAATVFPPTNRVFAMTQSHGFRVNDGRVVEHWANRDDLGMGR
jgi:hypothetical protein